MKYQPGIDERNLAPELRHALGFLDAVFLTFAGRELVVTALRDSHAGRVSLHHEGKAVDCRTRDLSQNVARMIRHFLREHLDPRGFDTVLETDHLHVEYDPKPGEEFIGKAEE